MTVTSYTMASRRFLQNVGIPLAFFCLLIVPEIRLLYKVGMPPTIKGYITYLLEVATFLINLLWVAPLVFVPKQRWRFVARLVLLIVVHHIIRCLLAVNQSLYNGFLNFMLSADRFSLTAWRLEYALGASFSIVAIMYIGQRQLRQKQTELELIKTRVDKERIESTMAQMQLSPHLLLNGLSHLQACIGDKVPEAAHAIELMGEMLKPTLVNSRKVEMVPLRKTIAQLHNRIAFEQLLNSTHLYITIQSDINEDERIYALPPSLLMPAIENVLKYGDLHRPDRPARIQVLLHNGVLSLTTWNLKKDKVIAGTGLGLESVMIILNHYYPGRHSLIVTPTETEYTLNLTIKL